MVLNINIGYNRELMERCREGRQAGLEIAAYIMQRSRQGAIFLF